MRDDAGTDGADDVEDTVIRPVGAATDGPVDDPFGDTVIRPRHGRRAAAVPVDGVGPDDTGVQAAREPAPIDGVDPDDTDVRAGREAAPDDDPFGDTVIRAVPVPLDDPFGDTVIRPRTGVGTPPAAPASQAGPASAPEDTVVRPRTGAGRPAGTALPPPPPGVRDAPTGAGTSLPAGDTPAPRVPSIRIGDHVFRLDRPVVVGRRPALQRVVRGAEPQLVTVLSASGQVSSSHLLVHASGEAAVVEDLHSTNGTVVRPVAGAPFRMPSGGTVVVLTGTVVEIGDGNVIEILSPYLRAAPRDSDPAPPGWP